MTAAATSEPIKLHEVGDFRVPAFRFSLEGEGDAPQSVIHDVQRVTYSDSVDDIDSFDITLSNWDASRRRFKYVGVPGELDGSLFEPGRKIALHMGYEGRLEHMLDGEITRLEPTFPESGNPTVTVSGKNELHGFRRQQHTWSWRDKTDSEIAEWIGSQPIQRDRPGIDFDVRAPKKGGENPHDFVFMSNEHDIVFLLRRARRRGYTLALRGDGEDRHLYFGPQNEDAPGDRQPDRVVVYELEWGRSLVSFDPDLTTANQVAEVTVRGWDRRSGRPIEGTASLSDLDLNADQRDVARAVSGRREVIYRPVRSRREADRTARAILQQNAEGLVMGSGVSVGLPKLRSGEKVVIRGLGPRFSGRYYVTSTTHTLGDRGYRTKFTARREAPVEEQNDEE